MGITTTTTAAITCDHCGRVIDPSTEQVFRVRVIAETRALNTAARGAGGQANADQLAAVANAAGEPGDGQTFTVVKDETTILCPTDAMTGQADLVSPGQAPVIPPYPS